MHTSAPKPPVTERMNSTGSFCFELQTWVAPKPFAHSSLRSSMSTPMIVEAPASRAPAMAASPTPPQPKTATDWPRVTPAVLRTAPRPAITPQPSRPAAAGEAAGSTLVHCPAATSVLSQNAPMPSAGDSSVPSANVIFWRGVVRVEAVLRLAPPACPTVAAHGTPVEDHVVAGGHVGDALADRLDDPGGLVAEQEREVVVDPALAVVQVGVADPARLDGDDGLTRPGIGDDDRLHRHGLALRSGDDSTNLLTHAADRSAPVEVWNRVGVGNVERP